MLIALFFFLFELDRLILGKIILSLIHKYVKIKWKAAGLYEKIVLVEGAGRGGGGGQTITLSDWLHHYPIPTGPLHKTIIRIALYQICSEQSYYHIIYTVYIVYISCEICWQAELLHKILPQKKTVIQE